MDKRRSTISSFSSGTSKDKDSKEMTKKDRGDCDSESTESSHTHFFKKDRHMEQHERVTREQYLGISESISSSDTFRCIHGEEGKQYTEQGLLKRNFLKVLDPIPFDRTRGVGCPPAYGWDILKTLAFMVKDPMGIKMEERLEDHIRDLATISNKGYKIEVLDNLCVILDYVVETVYERPSRSGLRAGLVLLLKNMEKPIVLSGVSDVGKYFDLLRDYMGFLGYLLLRLEADEHFDLVSKAVIWQLSAPDATRGPGAAKIKHTLAAAAPVLIESITRMLALASSHRFPTFLQIAFLLACDAVDSCIEMMKENILENIFYHFNPYFPHDTLAVHDVNPAKLDDVGVRLGASGKHMGTTLSLLMVLAKTTKQYIDDNPRYRRLLPCPDDYGQRCFIWMYRYECRAPEHRQRRVTLTVLVSTLLWCFGDRLRTFSLALMSDVLTLSVATEIPPRGDWTSTVSFTATPLDVQFKKSLIQLSVDFLKIFPHNRLILEFRHWILGLIYLLDPGLSQLRFKWSPPLFSEIRKIALQALVCVLPLVSHKTTKDYGLIRRIMWYIEWYLDNPYDLSVLYWCLRVLQVATYPRTSPSRKTSVQDIFNTHGIIILMGLCYNQLQRKVPPVEKSQAVLSLCLRIMTSAVEANAHVTCCVYPLLKWPESMNTLALKMLDIVLFSLNNQQLSSDKWLIALLNFIWQAIIWKREYREPFIANDGVYKLLDIVTMVRAPVQSIALALVSDVVRAGEAVAQLVSWRACPGASNAYPMLVKRGSTIATLLAAVFRNDCKLTGVYLDQYGIIQDLDNPLMTSVQREMMMDPEFYEGKSHRTVNCWAAADIPGSRMAKAYTILYLLSEDLKHRVAVADEAFNLYKNIDVASEDEAVLVLCSHYLTIKLNQAWWETQKHSPPLLPQDDGILEEFLHAAKGWAKEIQLQQKRVIEKDWKKEHEEERSLYSFLGRVRLNIALDALREVRCVTRTADRMCFIHALLYDAVSAHQLRNAAAQAMDQPVLKTYEPAIDDHNMTGQNVKVFSIGAKDKRQPVASSATDLI